VFRDGETRRKEDWKFGLPCIDYKRVKQGQPTNQSIDCTAASLVPAAAADCY
jgi:hypothetical protein